MGRPFKADGRQTRLAFLDAALELFADKGYFGTSLRDIAAKVGVRESALYNHFTSKEALFDALLESASESRAEHLATFMAAEPSHDLRATFERLTALVLDYFSERRQQLLFRVMTSDGMRLARQGRLDLIERMTTGVAPIDALIRRLIDDGRLKGRDPQMLVVQFMGPLMLWRYLHALGPEEPIVANRTSFIREHVTHFLDSAATVANERMRPHFRQTGSSRPRAPRRVSRRKSIA
jgi:AcrR family transcriptional regulator